MVLLCGIPTDNPLERIADALEAKDIPFLTLNQHDYDAFYLSYRIDQGKTSGELAVGDRSVDLEDITGVYNRMTDIRAVPEYRGLKEDDPRLVRALRAHDMVTEWISICEAHVVNHIRAMASNGSKPYQMMLIESYGFKTPASLITNEPGAVLAFRKQYGTLVYKSASGVRSIVQELDEEQLPGLERIARCPVLFQQRLEGSNIRVHVVGRELFATRVTTNRIDYRYATRFGGDTQLETYALPPDIAARCIAVSEGLQLPVAGIDLLLTPEGEWYCFEANPSPGFSYFEEHTGQPIAAAIAGYLANAGN